MEIARSPEPWDVVVLGGGATGLGTALDSALRGYRTLLLEAHDFASGGYNMVSWTGTGFSFWAVSDLEPSELDGFVKAYRTAVAP